MLAAKIRRLPPELGSLAARYHRSPERALAPEVAAQARRDYAAGYSLTDLAEIYGVGISAIKTAIPEDMRRRQKHGLTTRDAKNRIAPRATPGQTGTRTLPCIGGSEPHTFSARGRARAAYRLAVRLVPRKVGTVMLDALRTYAEKRDDRRLGGTDIAALMGRSDYAVPWDVYSRIVDGTRKDPTPAMLRGQIFERAIARLWQAELHPEAQLRWFSDEVGHSIGHPTRPWQRISPDLLIEWPHEPAEVADVKRCRGALARHGDGVADYEKIQVTVYLEALRTLGISVEQARLLVHDPYTDEIHEWVVPYDAELARQCVEAGTKFWAEHIEPRIPPPIDGSEAARRHLERNSPRVLKDLLAASKEDDALAEQLRALHAVQRATEEEEERIRNLLRERIGAAQGIRGAWGSVQWSEQKRAGKTDWKRAATELAKLGGLLAELDTVAEACTEPGTTIRTLRTYWRK